MFLDNTVSLIKFPVFHFYSVLILYFLFFHFPVILVHLPVLPVEEVKIMLILTVLLQKGRRSKCVSLTRELFRFILEMMLKPFRNREMTVMSKFRKMTGGSEIQKYKLVTKPLIYKKNILLFTFLPVSKARTNKFYFFRQCTYI